MVTGMGKKTLAIATVATVFQTITTLSAQAGPVLSFRANYGRINGEQCIQRGVAALRSEGFPISTDAININNTSFVGGETQSTSAIVDCSEVPRSGRVTIMVSALSNDRNSALDLAERLLSKVLTP